MKKNIAIALCFISAHVHAADNSKIQQSNLAMNLFLETCTNVVKGNDAILEKSEQLQLKKSNKEVTQFVLGSEMGQVWQKENPIMGGGDFLLILKPEGSCSVWARRADSATAQENLRRLAKKLERPELEVKQTLDNTQKSATIGDFHQLGFTMQKVKNDGGAALMLIATTSESNNAPKQLTISIYPSPRF